MGSDADRDQKLTWRRRDTRTSVLFRATALLTTSRHEGAEVPVSAQSLSGETPRRMGTYVAGAEA